MKFDRRSFLKGLSVSAALASGGCSSFFVGKSARVVGPGQKVRMGIVGVGGKGTYDWTHLMGYGAEIVAFCDVDAREIDAGLAEFQKLGGDPSKVEEMREAFKKGYEQAEKTWGGELPEISKQTYEAVMKKFDDLAGQSQN